MLYLSYWYPPSNCTCNVTYTYIWVAVTVNGLVSDLGQLYHRRTNITLLVSLRTDAETISFQNSKSQFSVLVLDVILVNCIVVDTFSLV